MVNKISPNRTPNVLNVSFRVPYETIEKKLRKIGNKFVLFEIGIESDTIDYIIDDKERKYYQLDIHYKENPKYFFEISDTLTKLAKEFCEKNGFVLENTIELSPVYQAQISKPRAPGTNSHSNM